MVPLDTFKALSNDLLDVSNSIVQQANKVNMADGLIAQQANEVARAYAASKTPAVPAPVSLNASVALPTQPLNTTTSTQAQAAKRRATFLKMATDARDHHAKNEFSRTLFQSVMGRDPTPHDEEPK